MSASSDPVAETDEHETFLRSKTGIFGIVIVALGVGISLLHIYFNVLTILPQLLQNGLHYSGFALLCALLFPTCRWDTVAGERLILALDITIGLIAAFAAIYMVAAEDDIYARGVRLDPVEWALGIALILSAIEFTRRTTGWIVPILIILAITYVGWWGSLIGGVFEFSGLSWETILFRSIYGDDGLFGNIALISSSFVFMFILFGAFLLRSGAGDFVIDLARAVAGKTVGAPGQVAVIASGLTGTISGSAVANTASTGVVTIPLMKKAGFPARFAAGVEAAASTGGQLMPPIMGAGAFVMASYTQIPYTTIVAVSVLPAILYFASIAMSVRIEAKKFGVAVLGEDGAKASEVLRKSGLPFLLPILVLIGLLMYGLTPTYAAGISILAVIVSSWLTPNKMGPRAIIEAMALGARNMMTTAILLCSVGLIVNVIATAGIGNTFSLMIITWAGDSLLIAISLIALASLVLGMGLPVTAAYIMLATVSAPALYNLISNLEIIDVIVSGAVPDSAKSILLITAPEFAEKLGQPMSHEAAKALLDKVPIHMMGTLRDQILSKEKLTFALLSAHMIIFWLSQDSNVTPPVCLTAFTAAAIAKTPPMATGLTSWKLAKGLYIVPLLFAYTHFLGGNWYEVLSTFVFGLAGIYALVGVLDGYLERPVNIVLRLVLLGSGLALLWPGHVLVHMIGLVVFLAVFVLHIRLQP